MSGCLDEMNSFEAGREPNGDNPEDDEQTSDKDGEGLNNWSHVDTPPPSPPPTPPLEFNDREEEYDGFVSIDHEDLEIYERFYAEDSEQELRELRELT